MPNEKIKFVVGWQEWCALPNIGIPLIKAKIDTGAKTSALHAVNTKRFRNNRADWVSFIIHPLQGHISLDLNCKAKLIDVRDVISSNGIREERYVIETLLQLGEKAWLIDLTLSNREPMKFRMLLGRQALKGHTIVDTDYQCKTRKISKVDSENTYNFQKKK